MSSEAKAKKTQPRVMLVFPGIDGKRYRIVSFNEEGTTKKYVIDEEREDTVGDKFWHPTGTWWLNPGDPKVFDLLMSAILHLMNPNALMANDAALEGREADAAKIMNQQAPVDSKKTCPLTCTALGCRLPLGHADEHETAYCTCGELAHFGKCHEAHP